MKLYFVRYGQTDYNVKGLIQGGLDTELNARGLDQAMDTAKQLADYGIQFDAVFSSSINLHSSNKCCENQKEY